LEGSNAGGGFLGFSGLFSPHWAFPMVFVVVVVVVVVLLLVEFERVGSCEWIWVYQKPLWDAIVLSLCISTVLAISSNNNSINVRASTGRQTFCIILEVK